MGSKGNVTRHLAPAGVAIAVATVLVLALSAGPGEKRGEARGGGGTGDAPAPGGPVSGSAKNGKRLYVAHGCYACHGYSGETGARVLVGDRKHLATEQDFLVFLRARADVAPRNRSKSMPNFAVSTLPDAQAKDLYAHIRTFTSNAPELKDIPALKAIVAAAAKPSSLERPAAP